MGAVSSSAPSCPVTRPRWPKRSGAPTTDTIHRRYLGGHPQVAPELLNFLTNVDYTSRFALVAVEPASGRGVAIARYEPAEQDGTADVAVAVTPGWRGAGLATELLRMLAQAASERGIHTFTGTYLAENRPVTALINTTDAPADQVTSHGVAKFSVALPPRIQGPRARDRTGQRRMGNGRARWRCDDHDNCWQHGHQQLPCAGRVASPDVL